MSYYASVRFGMNTLKLQDTDPITADDGLKISARIAKNRCVYDNPFKKCEFYVIYGEGVDKLYEIMENAPEAGILRKSGSWYYYEETDGELIYADKATVGGKVQKDFPMKFQGKSKLRAFLTENEWFAKQLKDELRGKAARGELMPKFQDDEEMKDIERLEKIDAEIGKELASAEKAKPIKKATGTTAKSGTGTKARTAKTGTTKKKEPTMKPIIEDEVSTTK